MYKLFAHKIVQIYPPWFETETRDISYSWGTRRARKEGAPHDFFFIQFCFESRHSQRRKRGTTRNLDQVFKNHNFRQTSSIAALLFQAVNLQNKARVKKRERSGSARQSDPDLHERLQFTEVPLPQVIIKVTNHVHAKVNQTSSFF